ncbi:MAG: NAD-dependent epimerase/dehydratase family protein [bacterium]
MIEPRVLVTGATGMVGSAIVRALLERKRSVRVLARNPERARALFGASVSIAAGDLGAPASLRQACDGIREIYHAAAELGFRGGSGAEMHETNVEGTRRLLDAAQASGVSRLVYTSSVAVYGDHLARGITETAPATPSSAYGRSKAQAERLVREADGRGLRCVIVRPCIVYGADDRYFIPQTVSTMRLPVIPLPDGGRHVVDLVHADDVAAAHLLVMEAGQPGGAYNVTDGGCYRLRELIGWMSGALDRSPWCPSISPWVARRAVPWVRIAGRLARIPEMASLQPQDVDVFLCDYHFDIAKITALGYAPRHQAPTELPRVLRECARRQRPTWSGSPAPQAQDDWESTAERSAAPR